MPRACCKLHKLLDSSQFPNLLDYQKLEGFSVFIEDTVSRRLKAILPTENPNDIEVYFYLFVGSGTRYLSTVAGEFLTISPNKSLLSMLKWYPVISTKLTHQTKSLSFLGKTTLPIAILLLLTYHDNYLKQHQQFELNFHMTMQLQTQCLLYMLLTTQNFDLQRTIGRRLTCITLCNDSPDISTFITDNGNTSLHFHENRTIYNHFPPFLCKNSQPKKIDISSETPPSWNNLMLYMILNKNWTRNLDQTTTSIVHPLISANISNIFSMPQLMGTWNCSQASNTKKSYQMYKKLIAPKKQALQHSQISQFSPNKKNEDPNTFTSTYNFNNNTESSPSTETTNNAANLLRKPSFGCKRRLSATTFPSISVGKVVKQQHITRSLEYKLSCCKPNQIVQTLNSMSYSEFASQKQTFLKILKDYSYKKLIDTLIFFLHHGHQRYSKNYEYSREFK